MGNRRGHHELANVQRSNPMHATAPSSLLARAVSRKCVGQGICLSNRNASAASTVRNGRNIHQATAVKSMLNTSDLSGSIPFVQYLHPDTFTILLWMTNKCVTNDCHVVSLRLEQLHLQPSKHIRNRQIQLCVCKTISHSQASALDFDND